MPLNQLVMYDTTLKSHDGRGRPVDPSETFVSGLDSFGFERRGTTPTADNVGVDSTAVLIPYTGPSAGGQLNVSTPNTIYRNIDFGNTRVKVNAANVQFENCRWTITDQPFDTYSSCAVDWRPATQSGGRMFKCTIINVAQNVRGMTGVMGWNVRVERCKVEGFVDQLGFYVPGSPGQTSLPYGVLVLDCWLGPMCFMWDPVGGKVHNSDTKTHNDNIQFQGGYDAKVINTTIIARYSETVGTGTPNSGSDTGWPGLPYTQAEGVAKRYEIVFGSGTYDNPAARDYALGGSISGIMVNTSKSKGRKFNVLIAYCYGEGGGYWLNAAGPFVNDDTGEQYPFGTVKGCYVTDSQRHDNYAIAIQTGIAATVIENYWSVPGPNYASTGVLITRRNA